MKKTILLITAPLLLLMANDNLNEAIKLCISCHGNHFEKQALGVSRVVQNMSENEILKALQGYKNGTYGRANKAHMKNALKDISDLKLPELSKLVRERSKTQYEKDLENSKKAVIKNKRDETDDINNKESLVITLKACLSKASTQDEIIECTNKLNKQAREKKNKSSN